MVAAQRSGKAPPALTYAFAYPTEEPLLWIADAIASSITACGDDMNPAADGPILHLHSRVDT